MTSNSEIDNRSPLESSEIEITIPEPGSQEMPLPELSSGTGKRHYSKRGFLSRKDENAIINGIRKFKPLYIIARELGVCRQTLYRYLREKMDIDYKDMKESMIDVAENRLFKNILDGNQNAIQFFLDRQGRHRGYGEKQQLDRNDVPVINIGKIEISKQDNRSIGDTVEAEIKNV